MEEIFCRHGAPKHILSDRGANFLSTLIQDVWKYLNVKKVNTSGYHPQTDGLVERFNSTLMNMLSKINVLEKMEKIGTNSYPLSRLPI